MSFIPVNTLKFDTCTRVDKCYSQNISTSMILEALCCYASVMQCIHKLLSDCESTSRLCIHRLSVDSQAIIVGGFVLLAWTSCWTYSRVAGDLRRHDHHVTLLSWCNSSMYGQSIYRSRLGTQFTYLTLDKMATISQTIISDAFLWMKSFVFRLKFHLSLFLGIQLTTTQHWFR